MRDRFARDNEGKRSCKCDRNGNSAETQPLYRDFNSAVIGTRRAMMGNRLVDSSTGNRDGIITEFSRWWRDLSRGCSRCCAIIGGRDEMDGWKLDPGNSYRKMFLLSVKGLWIYICYVILS